MHLFGAVDDVGPAIIDNLDTTPRSDERRQLTR